jgi:hypothetical protein
VPPEFSELAIPEQKVFAGKPFPLVLQPSESTKSWSFEQWEAFFKEKASTIHELMVHYGAVLYRNFPAPNAEHCDRWVKTLGYKTLRK